MKIKDIIEFFKGIKITERHLALDEKQLEHKISFQLAEFAISDLIKNLENDKKERTGKYCKCSLGMLLQNGCICGGE